MQLEITIQERERQISYDDITYIWNVKYDTDSYVECKTWHKQTHLWNRKRITDIENRLGIAKG